jgi:hypothetical protein
MLDRTRLTSRITEACLVAALLGSVGCGGPARIDATNEQTFKDSSAAITAKMTEAQKAEFGSDCATVMMKGSLPELMKKAMDAGAKPPKEPAPGEIAKPLHGLTAAEVHAKAEAIRAGFTKK